MAGVRWDDIHVTRVRSIDDQHHHLVDLINRLQQRMPPKDAGPLRVGLLNELRAFAVFHFQSEANLMLEFGYPNLEAHDRAHRELVDNLDKHIEGVLAAKEDMAALVMFVWKWLVNHTDIEDRALGVYLRRCGLS